MVLVYLSGPIIHNELRKDDFFRTISLLLSSRGISVFAPQFLGPAEPSEIYRRDVEAVRKSDIIIAEVSNPSLGVGMEIMLAIELEIPLLLFRHTDAKPLSKMVLGVRRKVLFEYTSIEEVVEILGNLDFEKIGYSHECPECGLLIAESLSSDIYRCIQCDIEFK